MLDHQNHDPIVFRVSAKHNVRLSQMRYLTFSLIGLALLWPWNCFLSASAYYDDRFVHTPALIKIYSSTMMSVSSVASALYNFYLSQVQAGVNYNSRLNIGLVLTVGVFFIMAISCVSDLLIRMSDTIFFSGLMSMVFLSALATCLAQNGTMAVVNVLGGIYANAVMVGQAVAGVLPACVLILSILIIGEKPNLKEDGEYTYVDKNFGVFAYYITASLISVASMLLFFWIGHFNVENTYNLLTEIVERDLHEEYLEEDNIDEMDVNMLSSATQTEHVPFLLLWSKLKYNVSTIFITFCVTLIFPVFASKVESTHYDSTSPFLQKKIYIPFIYLIWNLGDLMGRVLCGTTPSILIKNTKFLLWYSIARLAFIPLFLTCNIHPEEGRTPFINSDIWYILLQFLFGLSNGQLSTSSFMTVAEHCDTDNEKEAAGGFTTVFLSSGLAIGSLLSYLLVLYIN